MTKGKIKVQNIVSVLSAGNDINISLAAASYFTGASHTPDFPACHSREEGITVTFFSNGKAVETGFRTYENGIRGAYSMFNKLATMNRPKSTHLFPLPMKINPINVVSSANLKMKLDLNLIRENDQFGTELQPSIFPGLRKSIKQGGIKKKEKGLIQDNQGEDESISSYMKRKKLKKTTIRIPENEGSKNGKNICIILFKTGKTVVTGASDVESVVHLKKIVEDYVRKGLSSGCKKEE